MSDPVRIPIEIVLTIVIEVQAPDGVTATVQVAAASETEGEPERSFDPNWCGYDP